MSMSNTNAASSNVASAQQNEAIIQETIISAMSRIDPFLRFLTKATGKTSVPLQMLRQVLPKLNNEDVQQDVETDNDYYHQVLLELSHRGVLSYNVNEKTIGFPLPPSPTNNSNINSSCITTMLKQVPSKLIGKGLHGSSETSARRRMNVLQWSLGIVPSWVCKDNTHELSPSQPESTGILKTSADSCKTTVKGMRTRDDGNDDDNNHKCNDVEELNQSRQVDIGEDERYCECIERRAAYLALDVLLSGSGKVSNNGIADRGDSVEQKRTAKQWLPCQAAYAGSHQGREVRYGKLSNETLAKIPGDILKAFNLDVGDNRDNSTNKSNVLKLPPRRLFLHQALAIESTMNNIHTVVQTATGSGKSICFLIPVLAKAMSSLHEGKAVSAALLLFPTKALAQDQLTKIVAILQTMDHSNTPTIRVGVIDGDTPHSQREEIATNCQIILTNPDTLHAAILPNWKKNRAYQLLLSRVTTVVVDEAHVYEGAFGAHVSMVLSRLLRICRVASSPSNTGNNVTSSSTSISFIACSATMLHPEEQFRLLMPVGKHEKVCVLTSRDDGSPCPPKHFFVWNPPILDVNGISTDSVFLPKKNDRDETVLPAVDNACKSDKETSATSLVCAGEVVDIHIGQRKKKRKVYDASVATQRSNLFTRRRHAADETAFLLAKAIIAGVRTIAFCKTRSLVEWVYNACLAILHSNPATAALSSQVESYRGGYTAEARRSIEERLFHRKLIGVVGTCALELGVDVGGVDLTLHTGYPGSISSLLQQSGRAGREKSGLSESSCAIMVCFSSPSEQYIWKNPTCLLSRGVDAPPSLPINETVLHGHLLCAGEEFPLTGDRPVSCLLNENSSDERFCCPSDCDLFGGPSNGYYEGVNTLAKSGHLSPKKVQQTDETIYSTHPVLKNSWKRVSLRSIEPVSYSIVDLSHNLQAGKTDKLHHQSAVLDTIPYSRVFYHAFPGAILLHRGMKYQVESMEHPPPFLGASSFGPCGCNNLLAFAKPTSAQYSTQPLNINEITIVKQMKHAEARPEGCVESNNEKHDESMKKNSVAVAGCGIVTVKRSVHGYKKLSHVNRTELSRTTISVPPMEFDTRACWIDADAAYLRDVVVNFDGGIHALSHAMIAVAPLFISCSSSDIDCDHSRYATTQILLYDQRAGGSGTTSQLYNFLADALRAAVELLEDCTSCYSSNVYDGGCPACLQSVSCDNFHDGLSRNAGIVVGKHLLKRLENSTLNKRLDDSIYRSNNELQYSIKPTNIVIGRASWSPGNKQSRWAEVDDVKYSALSFASQS